MDAPGRNAHQRQRDQRQRSDHQQAKKRGRHPGNTVRVVATVGGPRAYQKAVAVANCRAGRRFGGRWAAHVPPPSFLCFSWLFCA